MFTRDYLECWTGSYVQTTIYIYISSSQILTMKRITLEQTLAGNTINLVSNDAQKLDQAGEYVVMVISAPLEIVGSCFVLWHLIGWQALIGVGFMMLVCLCSLLLSRTGTKLRSKAAAVTDQRLSVINEIISGIRAVKICAWEDNYCRLVKSLRR